MNDNETGGTNVEKLDIELCDALTGLTNETECSDNNVDKAEIDATDVLTGTETLAEEVTEETCPALKGVDASECKLNTILEIGIEACERSECLMDKFDEPLLDIDSGWLIETIVPD